ncbi:MAG TPA: prohibitin family protein [Pyrinomonadaceae bacterium]|nr:prohibitin family protein [Pyrinomonadaceae bacterium]
MVIYLMVATLVAVVLYPHVVVTVPSGHVGVLWKRFAGGTVLDPRRLRDEGLHLIWPWDQLFLYDLRLQSFTESYNAISSDGVSLTANVNVRFRLQRDAVPVLHQAIGPNYQKVLVQPGIGSLTREVIAQYTAEQVYSTARQEIQDKIRSLVEDRLTEKMMEREGEESYRVSMRDTVILYDILVAGIELPAAIVAAINRKTEQYYIAEEYKFRVEREKRESERKKIEAEGIRDFQQTVSQGISESYLRWRGIEATLQLSQSTNSKVVVIGGGKDGLPIILGNVDTPLPPAGAPAENGTTAKPSATAAGPAVPLEKTPAAGLATPPEKIPAAAGADASSATTPEPSRWFWPLSLSDTETYLYRIVRPAEPKTEPKAESRTRQPAEKPVAEQPR